MARHKKTYGVSSPYTRRHFALTTENYYLSSGLLLAQKSNMCAD